MTFLYVLPFKYELFACMLDNPSVRLFECGCMHVFGYTCVTSRRISGSEASDGDTHSHTHIYKE